MKPPVIVLGFALLAAAVPAAAQNKGQINQAQRGASCPKCNLFQADFTGLEVPGRSFAGARLRQSDMSLAVMNRTNFAGADLRDVEAYGAVLSGGNFTGADLTHASFVGAYLVGSNFTGAKLEGTNFSGASLNGAKGLSQAQLNRACGDPSTGLPRGLRIPAC
ncbi:MAG: pentapeptide repeat-containing protein [Pseudomonadota bacterium]